MNGYTYNEQLHVGLLEPLLDLAEVSGSDRVEHLEASEIHLFLRLC